MPDQSAPTVKEQRNLKQEMKEQRRQSAARRDRTKNAVTWSIVGAVVIGIVALIVMSSKGNGNSTTVAAVTDQDHIRGLQSASAVIIEYSDFQCPACGAYYPTMKSIEQKYGDRIGVVYRHYPLTQLHQNAELAARASEAANLQNKFWEMHDLLFERQKVWSTDSAVAKTFTDYAQELNMDAAKFTADLNSSAVKDRVAKDVTSGNVVGITGTPTFFLNGKKLTNPGSEEAFIKLIDAELGPTNQ